MTHTQSSNVLHKHKDKTPGQGRNFSSKSQTIQISNFILKKKSACDFLNYNCILELLIKDVRLEGEGYDQNVTLIEIEVIFSAAAKHFKNLSLLPSRERARTGFFVFEKK